MTFDRQQFQSHMDSLEGKSKASQQTMCDQLKEDFLKMSWDERKEAFTLLNEHNQKHETKLTIEGAWKETISGSVQRQIKKYLAVHSPSNKRRNLTISSLMQVRNS